MTTLTAPLPSGSSAVADRTPARRERYVDFLRVFSLAVVMLGHWLMAVVEWRDGRLVADNVLESAPAAQWLTWVFQIMPVFFVVGGFSNTASWTAAVRDGRGYGDWLTGRLVRLVRPVLAFALVWAALVAGLVVMGIDPGAVRAGSIAQPLWFLAVYVVVVAVAPALVAAQRRWGWAVAVGLGAGVALVDLARWPLGVPLVGWANLALVWLFAHQLGVAWRDGAVDGWSRRRSVGLALAGLGGLVVLTGAAGYPHSMVGGVGGTRSNTFPPSLALVALATWQFGPGPPPAAGGSPVAGPAPGVGRRGGRQRPGHDRVPVAPERPDGGVGRHVAHRLVPAAGRRLVGLVGVAAGLGRAAGPGPGPPGRRLCPVRDAPTLGSGVAVAVGRAGRDGGARPGRRNGPAGRQGLRPPRDAARPAVRGPRSGGRRLGPGAPSPVTGPAVGAVVAVGLLAAHNVVTNLWARERWYVPVNLVTAGVLVVLAGGRDVGLSADQSPGPGVAAAGAVLGVIVVLAVVPATRPLLADQRMAGVDGRDTAWRALMRIPLGTVVLEEVAFRGVLPVLLSPVTAAVLFGLWHVLPSARALDVNGIARSRPARAVAVAGAVAATTAVGLVLWELREATGGLLAPALVHAAANSGATVAAYAVFRSAAEIAPSHPLPDVAAEQGEEEAS